MLEKEKMNSERIREVDIDQYIPMLISVMKEGKEVRMIVTGNSMAPFLISKRDSIIVSKPVKRLKRGQMVFYQRVNGEYVMHRIHHIDRKGDLYMVGDAQQEIEGPLLKSQVFGQVVAVIRKDKFLKEGDFWWEFFEHIWIRIVPVRRSICKIVGRIR